MAANIQKGMKLDQIKTQKRPQISNPINKNVPSTILKKTTNKKQT